MSVRTIIVALLLLCAAAFRAGLCTAAKYTVSLIMYTYSAAFLFDHDELAVCVVIIMSGCSYN